MQEQETPKTIWQKLFEIQKQIKTFATSEDADKKDSKGRAEYKYTPGYEICEKIREHMDKAGLMLIPNCTSQESKLIDYLVYKDFHGQAMSFSKKEMFVQVSVEYTWVDTETGEKAGPFVSYGYGANGTDKSGASALSTAERYFLLKFFHITTREQSDELDAHDSSNIPGMSASEQPATLSSARSGQAVPAPAPYVPAGPQAGAYVQPVYCPYPQGYPQAGYVPAPGYQPGNAPAPAPAAPAPGANTPTGVFNASDPAIQTAITALMNFNKGTASHQRCLNEQLGKLASLGYRCMNKEFIESLTETAQSMRVNK